MSLVIGRATFVGARPGSFIVNLENVFVLLFSVNYFVTFYNQN